MVCTFPDFYIHFWNIYLLWFNHISPLTLDKIKIYFNQNWVYFLKFHNRKNGRCVELRKKSLCCLKFTFHFIYVFLDLLSSCSLTLVIFSSSSYCIVSKNDSFCHVWCSICVWDIRWTTFFKDFSNKFKYFEAIIRFKLNR